MTSKISNRLSILKSYLQKEPCFAGVPPAIGIEVTNRCNLDCIMCARQEMDRRLGDMSLPVLKKIIDESKEYLEFVDLQSLGEPLLHRDFIKMIKYCRANNVKCGFSTNASLLDEEKSNDILNSGVNHITIAFDGATKETYEKIRQGAKYDTVVSNIKHFLKLKNEKDSRCFVVIQCIYMRETEREIRAFKGMWNVRGVNALRIRQVTHGIRRDEPADEKFVNPKRSMPCFWLWREPHIHWDGTVVPCCQDINGSHPLGNIKNDLLADLWNSEKMSELRKIHVKGKSHEIPLCRECNMYQPNLPMAVGFFTLDAFTIKKLIPSAETFISKMRYKF
jgi:radical SAM protein with 4Fe4S-binding SPASM domain